MKRDEIMDSCDALFVFFKNSLKGFFHCLLAVKYNHVCQRILVDNFLYNLQVIASQI